MSERVKDFLGAFMAIIGVIVTVFTFSGRMVFDQFAAISSKIDRVSEKIDATSIDARNAQNKVNESFTIEIHAISERVDWLYKNGRYAASEPWPKSYKEENQK